MSEAVHRFCDMIAAFPEKQADDMAFSCCIALGVEMRPTGLSLDGPDGRRTLGELYHFPTLSDLRRRMTTLVAEMGVQDTFLIPALYFHLTRKYERLADPDNASDSIDFHLGLIEELKEDLTKSVSERSRQIPDAELQELIAKAEEITSEKPAQRIESEEIVRRLESEWAARFSDEYWAALSESRIRNLPREWGG